MAWAAVEGASRGSGSSSSSSRVLMVEDMQSTPTGSSSSNSQGQDSKAQLQQQQEDQQCISSSKLAVLQQLLLRGDAFPDTAAAAADDPFICSMTCPYSSEQLQQLISENAYSELSEDAGASLLRELSPESVTGLWPEFALLNHDCAPNTVAVVIGQYLLLRAAAPVLAGEELRCSYLGQRGLAPVASRRAYLQGVYGFHCQVVKQQQVCRVLAN
ncbi:hypothetical protein COO60DRAFT_1703525 [Scenedesmus sp. NREL 46B-D3]|nr:hypothetical protein COO60DRAFT_1703525 [Scenedesmus sp. NREL 46B-D3]